MTSKTTGQNIKDDRWYIIILSLFVFFFLFFVSKMSPLYPTNEWSDVNVYFGIGKAMMNGRILYTEAFDHKGPLIFVIYGIGYLMSNDSFLGMFVIQIICWIALVYSIFRTVQLYVRKEYAFLTAIIAPIFFIQYTHTGGSPEEFILIFGAISLYYFYKFFNNTDCKEHSPRIMFLHGVLVSLVLLIKLNLLIFWIFPILGIFICLIINKNYINLWKNALAFLCGILLIALPTLIYLWINGALEEAYGVYIVFNKKYGGLHDLDYTITLVKQRGYNYVMTNKIGAIISFIGAFIFPLTNIKNRIGKAAFLATGIALFFMIFTPRTFHFYYPLSVYIFIIPGLISIFAFVTRIINIKISKTILCIMAAIVVASGIYIFEFYGYDKDILLRKKKPNTPEFAFAEIIKKEKNPVLVNLGFGLGNNIFTLCNIVPSHKYFLTPNIYYSMYPDIRDSQTRYIENMEADFLVIDNFAFNYDYFKDLEVLHQNYELTETFVDKRVQIDNEYSVYYLYRKR